MAEQTDKEKWMSEWIGIVICNVLGSGWGKSDRVEYSIVEWSGVK